MTKAKQVILFTNGMIAAFDEKGEQIPEYQGFIFEVAEKLKTVCDKDTKFSIGASGIGEIEMEVAWWFEDKRGQPTGM